MHHCCIPSSYLLSAIESATLWIKLRGGRLSPVKNAIIFYRNCIQTDSTIFAYRLLTLFRNREVPLTQRLFSFPSALRLKMQSKWNHGQITRSMAICPILLINQQMSNLYSFTFLADYCLWRVCTQCAFSSSPLVCFPIDVFLLISNMD